MEGGAKNGTFQAFFLFFFVRPVGRERWPGWTEAAGRRSLQTRCPVWSDAETKNTKPVSKDSQCGLLFMYFILVTETHSP